jgi:hypothetical protein
MTKKFNIIYLSLAPVLFGLSWFISRELFNHFMKNKGTIENPAKDNSFVFACGFSFLYLLVFFIIRDLYPKKITSRKYITRSHNKFVKQLKIKETS